MRFSQNSGRRRLESEINVTSLVDVIFNLLLFFMLTTSFSQSTGLEVKLPSAEAGDTSLDPSNLIVVLTADGHTMIDGKSVTPDELDARIADQKKNRDNSSLIIEADATVPHGRVVSVIDAAKKAGLRTVSIATEGE
jgi:biopolymer transport protein ExbD